MGIFFSLHNCNVMHYIKKWHVMAITFELHLITCIICHTFERSMSIEVDLTQFREVFQNVLNIDLCLCIEISKFCSHNHYWCSYACIGQSLILLLKEKKMFSPFCSDLLKYLLGASWTLLKP